MTRKPKTRSTDSAIKPQVIDLEATEVAEPGAAPGDETVISPDEAATPSGAAAQDEAGGEAAETPGAEPIEPVDGQPGETSDDDAARPAPGRPGKRLVAGAVVIGLLGAAAGGALVYRNYGEQFFSSAQGTAARQALEARLTALETAQAAAADDMQALGTGAKAAADELDRAGAELVRLGDSIEAVKNGVQTHADALAALHGRLDDLEGRAGQSAADIAGLKSALAAAANAGAASQDNGAASALQIGEMSGNIAALGQRVKTLEDSLGASHDALAGLAARLDKVARRAAGSEAGGRAAQLAAAFSALEARIGEGKPFVAEIDALAGLDPNLAGLDGLRGLAESGVAGVDDLGRQLDAALAGLAGSDTAAAADGGWMAALKARVFSVVKIRKIGEADWRTAGAAAQAALARGDLDGALAAFGAPGKTTPEAIAAWQAAAEARRQALARLTALSVAVFQSVKRNPS